MGSFICGKSVEILSQFCVIVFDQTCFPALALISKYFYAAMLFQCPGLFPSLSFLLRLSPWVLKLQQISCKKEIPFQDPRVKFREIRSYFLRNKPFNATYLYNVLTMERSKFFIAWFLCESQLIISISLWHWSIQHCKTVWGHFMNTTLIISLTS